MQMQQGIGRRKESEDHGFASGRPELDSRNKPHCRVLVSESDKQSQIVQIYTVCIGF